MTSHKAGVAVSVPHRVRAILMHRGLGWHMSHTIVNLSAKAPRFVEMRRQGYALDDVEFEEGVHFVGASVVDYCGIPIATISASTSVSGMRLARA